MNITNSRERAFSLTEIMVAIAVFGIVSIAAYTLFMTSIGSLNEGENRIQAHDELQKISEELALNLRSTTALNLLDDETDVDIRDFSYIMKDNNQIVLFERNEEANTGSLNEAEERIVIGDVLENPEKGDEEYEYQLSFSSDDKVVNYSVGLSETNLTVGSNIYVQNLEDAISDNSGAVLEFVPFDENKVEDRSLDTNMFWLDFVMNAYSDTLEIITEGIEFSERTDGEELAVGIKGDGNTLGGIMFKKMTDDYFNDNKGKISSYSIIVDAKMEKPGNYQGPLGYGVLLRGNYKGQDEKDYGYMLQFDPGANGLVVRRIEGGDSNSDKHIGAYLYDDANTNVSPRHRGLYTTYELENDEFVWDSGSNSDDDDGYYGWNQWFKRYKTKIKVQTQQDGDLIIRTSLIDEDGNQSNEVWFGNFNKIKLNGSKFYGGDRGDLQNYENGWAHFERNKKLDWDYFEDHGVSAGELPGRYFALRSWSGDGFEVNFYEIKIAGAEPGVKNVEVQPNNISGNWTTNVTLEFDEALWFDGMDDLEPGNNICFDSFEFSSDDAGEIQSISKSSTGRELTIKVNGKVNSGFLKYNSPSEEELKLEDDQENFVRNFTVDLSLNGLVQ